MLRLRWTQCVVAMVGLIASPQRFPAQSATPNGPHAVGTVDGGTRQTLESLFIPPKAGAPFSLVLDTEWAKPMFSGGTYTVANRRRIMRDSTGRIYEERWGLVPKGSKVASEMTWIQIADPNAHTQYNCAVRAKRCFLLRYNGLVTGEYTPAVHPSGPLPNGEGVLVHEELGAGDVAGVAVQGVRETTTINPGAEGNDVAMVTVREFWYSAPLGIDLRSRLQSPYSGRQVFTASEVVTAEPESRFFAVPQGYTVMDQRETRPAEE